MNSPMMSGFADELVKVSAAAPSAVTQLLRRFAKTKAGQTARGRKFMSMVAKHHSKAKRALTPEMRARLGRAAGLGAATGATGAVASGGDEPVLRRALRGAVGGAASGAITGATFPGWFSKANRRL